MFDDPPLHQAALDGDLSKVRALLAGRADVNQVEEGSWTALQYAAIRGHVEVLQALLQALLPREFERPASHTTEFEADLAKYLVAVAKKLIGPFKHSSA